ncbi:MAG: ABC transporter substrate-binding protein [Gracilibacteraceae bacterium]|jgi:ABC-type nitrate/sulfonate/bicarbonate transport system substrate-binding protein|nr:ABC transporter substrate-binding protein [Gracilibacteraceae bacterium]
MKKRVLLLFLFLAPLLLWAACGKSVPPPNTDAALTQIRVVLDWTPNTNHSGLYAALAQGWFAEEGIEVEIMQPPEDGAMVLLAAGDADFGISFQEELGPAIARENPMPLMAVAAIINHNTSGIMSLAQTGIHSAGDLEGKKFASWETPLVYAIMRNLVEADGGDFARVNMIPNAATDAISALQSDMDAIWIYYAWDGIAAEIAGLEINYLDFGRVNPLFDFYTPVLVVNSDFAAANPGVVKGFVRAASRGYDFAAANPDQSAEFLLQYAPQLNRALVLASQRYLAPLYQGDAPRWGEIDASRWSAFYRWMFEEGLLEKDIQSGGFSNEYLP